MTAKRANPSTLRSEAGVTRRIDQQPCQLFCSSQLPATRCIAGVFICEPCFTRTMAIEAEAEQRGPEPIRSIMPRVLAEIERRRA